jgi:hypothetical protein
MNCDACNRKLVQNEDASWYCPYCGEHYGPWDGASESEDDYGNRIE